MLLELKITIPLRFLISAGRTTFAILSQGGYTSAELFRVKENSANFILND